MPGAALTAGVRPRSRVFALAGGRGYAASRRAVTHLREPFAEHDSAPDIAAVPDGEAGSRLDSLGPSVIRPEVGKRLRLAYFVMTD